MVYKNRLSSLGLFLKATILCLGIYSIEEQEALVLSFLKGCLQAYERLVIKQLIF